MGGGHNGFDRLPLESTSEYRALSECLLFSGCKEIPRPPERGFQGFVFSRIVLVGTAEQPEAFGEPKPDLFDERRLWDLVRAQGGRLLPALEGHWQGKRLPPAERVRAMLEARRKEAQALHQQIHGARLQAWRKKCVEEKTRATC